MLLSKTPKTKLDAYSRGYRVKVVNRLILIVRNHPKIIILTGIMITIIGLFGALQINPHSKLLDDLRPGNALLEDMRLAENKMGSVLPVEIIISIDENNNFQDIQDIAVISFADDLATYISKIPEIGKVVSVSDYLKAINQAMNEGTKSFYSLPSSREVISQYMLLYDSEFNSLINSDLTKLRVAAQIKDIDSRRSAEIEKEINTYIDTVIPNGMTAEVTGTAFLALRTNNYLVKNLLASFLVALIIITFLMVILFRSIKMAFISILPNIIPMMVMAAVLGFLQIPLRPATAMTFAVAFGIAVDDTLHYLIRCRMELSNRHYREANDSTMLGTGIAMMSTTAILSAGFLADGAYWLNSNSKWITSSHYRENIPKWIEKFHEKYTVKSYMNHFWKGASFNYDLNEDFEEMGPSSLKATPEGNNYTLDFSKELIINENLGTDTHSDFLIISFSSTDYVGHKFGPDAEELKSMYLNLDNNLSKLLKFLEEHCGKNNYLISLTSDHGAGTSPIEIERRGLKGGNFISREIFPELNKKLELVFGIPSILARYSNMQFYIDFKKIDSLKISETDVFLEAKKWLSNLNSVDEVYSKTSIANGLSSQKVQRLINGIYPRRSGDIFITLKPGFIEWSSKTGTTHGTHFNYDSHVPLIFYGFNIKPQQIYSKIKIIDIAPTLSIFLKTAFPNACTGNPIGEIFQEIRYEKY